jgi:hypothetical protein
MAMPVRAKSPAKSRARAASRSARPQGRRKAVAKLSHTRRPPELDAAAWQAQLRRQFGREQSFAVKNLGSEEIFSEFSVTNPQSQRSYRVAIRGHQRGDNYCACADFASNQLGTCKHIEYVLAQLERKRGAKQALARGFQPEYSEIYLSYGEERVARFRRAAGADRLSDVSQTSVAARNQPLFRPSGQHQ